MKEVVVQLLRRFTPTSAKFGNWDFLSGIAAGKPQRWNEMEDLYRVLILAEPGAGKTFEARDRATKIHERGRKSFFIRIEAIDARFNEAFEIGTAQEFEEWLTSSEEAWFFLDSVDEAQLETPRALEDSVRIFGTRIHDARERAHIFITSREDAWQALSDRTLIDRYLPHGAPILTTDADANSGVDKENAPVSALKVFRLAGLKADEIKLFASHHGIGDVNTFVDAIARGNLTTLAERPFDLKALIKKWLADDTLGSRLEVLRRMIEIELDRLTVDGATSPIGNDKARTAVRALAAAVTLTGRNIICLPDGPHSNDRLNPSEILPDWSDAQLNALLRRGVFDDIVYGSVRFRHREVRELLTAEWAKELSSHPNGRTKIEALLFRTQYGEEVIVPRLRPILPWLALLDEPIRIRALAIDPEIITEGGDPSQLPRQVRQAMLIDIVKRIAAENER